MTYAGLSSAVAVHLDNPHTDSHVFLSSTHLHSHSSPTIIVTINLRWFWPCIVVNVEIKCQLDATDDFYCRSYCLLNMFRGPLYPSSGTWEYYTDGCCLWYFVLLFSICRYGVELRVMCPVCGQQPANRTFYFHRVPIFREGNGNLRLLL
jgi:hypothetical protein